LQWRDPIDRLVRILGLEGSEKQGEPRSQWNPAESAIFSQETLELGNLSLSLDFARLSSACSNTTTAEIAASLKLLR
ncbi:hypothetical protein BGZ65_000187, partial [Modicella reniformis]